MRICAQRLKIQADQGACVGCNDHGVTQAEFACCQQQRVSHIRQHRLPFVELSRFVQLYLKLSSENNIL